jgi:hypothetical protein
VFCALPKPYKEGNKKAGAPEENLSDGLTHRATKLFATVRIGWSSSGKIDPI